MQKGSWLDINALEHHRGEMVSQIKEEQFAKLANPPLGHVGNIFNYIKNRIRSRSKLQEGEFGLYFRQITR